MLKGREQAQAELRDNIQEQAEIMGVDILFVGLADLRPPAESPENVVERGEPEPGQEGPNLNNMPVAAAFENPVSAQVDGQLEIYNATKESQRLVAEKAREVEVLQYDANTTSTLRVRKPRRGQGGCAEQNNHFVRHRKFIHFGRISPHLNEPWKTRANLWWPPNITNWKWTSICTRPFGVA